MSGIEKTELIREFTSGSDNRAEIAVLQLAASGSPSLVILHELLANQNPDIRWWATRSLAEIKATEVIPLLLQALRDPEPEIRQCAALALRFQPDPKAIPPLIHSLKASDQLLARLAGDALIAIGKDAVAPLMAVMEDDSPTARLEAVRALALIGDIRTIPTLIKVLDQDSAILDYWVEQGLERMGVGTVFYKP
jgi:HEAT repeat protein